MRCGSDASDTWVGADHCDQRRSERVRRGLPVQHQIPLVLAILAAHRDREHVGSAVAIDISDLDIGFRPTVGRSGHRLHRRKMS